MGSIIERAGNKNIELARDIAKEISVNPEELTFSLADEQLNPALFIENDKDRLDGDSSLPSAYLFKQRHELESSISRLEELSTKFGISNKEKKELVSARKGLIETEVDIALAITKSPNLFNKNDALNTVRVLKDWKRKAGSKLNSKLTKQKEEESNINHKHNLIRSVGTSTAVIVGLGVFSAAIADSWFAFVPFGLAGSLMLMFLIVSYIGHKQNAHELLRNKKALRELDEEIGDVQFVLDRLEKSKFSD